MNSDELEAFMARSEYIDDNKSNFTIDNRRNYKY